MSNEEQGAFNDVVIEDAELAGYLAQIADNQAAYDKYREGIRAARSMMEGKYKEYINIEDDGEHSGFIRCGVYRFVAKTEPREEKTETRVITTHAGVSWLPFDVKRADLFSGG